MGAPLPGTGVGGLGVPRVTCPRPWTRAARAGAEWGRARAADKGSDRSPHLVPFPPPPTTSAMITYLCPARPGGPRRALARPCLRPPRRDPWATTLRPAEPCAPHPVPRLGPGAAGVLRGSRSAGPWVGDRVRGAQRQRRAQPGPPRSAPRAEPRPARLPSSSHSTPPIRLPPQRLGRGRDPGRSRGRNTPRLA